MISVHHRILCGVAAVALVSGCAAAPEPPPPSPTGTTTSTTAPTAPPTVGSPVDVTPYAGGRACSLLTTRQVAELGFPGDATALFETRDDGPGCMWTRDDGNGPFEILSITISLTGDPLAARYRRSGDVKVFEEHTVRGLPSAATSDGLGDQCEVTIGTGNGQGIEILGHLVDDEDPELCDRLLTAAGWVIDAVQR